jgi:hypothetical protein
VNLILQEIIVEVFLRSKFQDCNMCSAFAQTFPRIVLAEAHAAHVWFACSWMQTFVLKRAQMIEVVL